MQSLFADDEPQVDAARVYHRRLSRPRRQRDRDEPAISSSKDPADSKSNLILRMQQKFVRALDMPLGSTKKGINCNFLTSYHEMP